MSEITRRQTLALMAGAVAGTATPLVAMESHRFGIDYLEELGRPGALRDGMAFLAPSQIDPAYSHVIYVNAALSGGGAQKMWVIERARRGWQLATWDAEYWAEQGLTKGRPPFSWPVSTGRKYPGDARSGPTPLGIFNVDERRHRHRPGWGSEGMYNSIYIDLHYSSGRASGVAIHGTTNSKYRLLGRADSHGCVRMTKQNSARVWQIFHEGKKVAGQSSPIWGQVPRYFTSEPRTDWTARWGYRRDGVPRLSKASETLTKDGYTALFVFFRDDV